MFDVVRNNPKVAQGILLVITVPLALFGIEAYFQNGGSKDVVARVGATEIVSQQVEAAVRDQELRLREQMGESFDRALLDTPEFRAGVLDRLINETAIKATIQQSKMLVPDGMVSDYIKARPEFQEDGKFSLRLYDAIIASQGRTRDGFEQLVRENLAQNQLLAPVVQSAVTPLSTAERLVALEGEERVVAEVLFDAKTFAGDVKLAADAAKQYYDANQSRFQAPELVKIEYVELNVNEIAKQIQGSEEDARAWYEANIKSLEQPEERRASHILVQVDAAAKPDTKALARKKAEDILAKVKASPAKFAQIAKENSDDKISAEKGGDLDFFGRGSMVKPFETAVFSLKPKEISGIVESDFGYHIIMLTDVRGGKTRSFDEVKAEAFENARKQAASKRFAELADQFGNLVYEQPDSLKPASEKFSLKLVQTDWMKRNALTVGILQSPKLQAALFSSDSLANRRNTEAVDLGNGVLVSARVIDYKPASVRPFEEVASEVEAVVKSEEAAKMAKARGEEMLGKLNAGESVSGVAWKSAKSLKRNAAELDAQARKAVFGSKTEKLPAFVGVSRDQGYAIYRIDAVKQSAKLDATRIQAVRQGYAMALGEEDLRAFISGVRDRLGVKIVEAKK